jgi:hypothetical protein
MGYLVKIEDGVGNEKYFFCKNAPNHVHASALAKDLIFRLAELFPENIPFTVRGNPRVGEPGNALKINSAEDLNANSWP